MEQQDIVLAIYERLEQHVDMHGQPVKGDNHIWQMIRAITKSDFKTLIEISSNNQYFDQNMEDWCVEVLERDPFYILKTNKKEKSIDSRMIWRLIMLMRESIEEKAVTTKN